MVIVKTSQERFHVTRMAGVHIAVSAALLLTNTSVGADSCFSVVVLPDALGSPVSAARGVSADGRVIAGLRGGGFEYNAVRWTDADDVEDLDRLIESQGAQAFGISRDGRVAVGRSWIGNALDGWADRAVRWAATGGVQDLGVLPGAWKSEAVAASGDGEVIVGLCGFVNLPASRAFAWTASAGMYALGTLHPDEPSAAFSVSADGSLVVGYSGSDAVRWIVGHGVESLGAASTGAVESYATDVSADGSVIVGNISVPSIGVRAFRWTDDQGVVPLFTDSAGSFSYAMAVSGDGNTVVGVHWEPQMHPRAFVWTATGGRILLDPLPGDTFSDARDVSDDGRTVVGTSGTQFGNRAVVWQCSPRVPPCPADIANTDGESATDGGGADGVVNNGDFQAFFLAFFLLGSDPRRLVADIANTDGQTVIDGGGPDGVIDNGDFVAFFEVFFAGCR